MDRASNVRRAWWLSVASVLMGGAVAIVALATGFATASLSTIGFGLDAAIDASASVVLVWRFELETRADHRGEHAEALAERLIGIVLCLASVVLAAGAVRALLFHEPAGSSDVQLALLVISVLALPPLALAKRRVAIRLGSAALRKDAILTGAAAMLAFVALVASQLGPALGVEWADAAGALVIAVVLAREGLLTLRR